MKSTRLALILSPLALAGATAVMWQDDGESEYPERQALTRGAGPPSAESTGFLHSARTTEVDEEVRESIASDPSSERVSRRLHELTEVLGLTSDQRREVRALLRRSSAGYDESAPIIGISGEPLVRLTRVRAQEGIHDLLDPLQQAEFEDLLLDDQLWWTDVIARLERDLEQVIDPPSDFNEPAEPARPEPPAHRGGNIFDLLNPLEP